MGIIIMIIAFWVVMWKTSLGRYTMFNPRVNSYTSIVFNILFMVAMVKMGSGQDIDIPTIVMINLWFCAIIDCIWDIREVSSFDEVLEYGDNFIYRIKVMVSFHTLGVGRAAFLLCRVSRLLCLAVYLLIEPLIIAVSVWGDVKMIKKNKIMPQQVSRWNSYRTLSAEQDFQEKYWTKLSILIEREMEKGSILSNGQIVDEILREQNEKFIQRYMNQKKNTPVPAKIVEKVAGLLNEEIKEAKRKAEKEEIEQKREQERIKSVIGVSPSIYYAYIDARFYKQCKDDISKALSGHGTLSPSDIVPLVGLQNLVSLHKGAFDADRGEYFIYYFMLYVLKELEQEGVVKENSYSDNILDLYQYSHIHGIPMASRNAESNPRLAL